MAFKSTENHGDGDHRSRKARNPWPSEKGDLVLEFHDKKITQKFCLILREYDGKGVFVIRLENQEDVVGLFEIVHMLKMKHLVRPVTVGDIVARYVVDISTYENSMDAKNLVTGRGVRVRMSDPLIKVFQGGLYATEVLYLQNKKYLRRRKNEVETSQADPLTDSFFTKSDVVGIGIALLLLVGVFLVFYFVPYSPSRDLD